MLKENSKTILVSPLEWGLGHSARLVPVIQACMERGWKVVIAADGKPLNFLRGIFPELEWEILAFTNIKYSRNKNFISRLLPQIPSVIRAIRNNRKRIGFLVKKYEIDALIGDHRYGLFYPQKPSVFISNQIWLIAPNGWKFAEYLVYRAHLYAVRKFSFIWLVDFPGSINFTGKQTHLPKRYPHHRFIGPISRFDLKKLNEVSLNANPDILIILSGPEPQRGILEEIIKSILFDSGHKVVVLRGIPPVAGCPIPTPVKGGKITWFDHADDTYLAGLILSAKKIVTRPGLSMLSDLAALKKTALLIPTPGQTEQNYMAKRLTSQRYFSMVKQGDLSIESINSFRPENNKLFPQPDFQALNNAIDELF